MAGLPFVDVDLAKMVRDEEGVAVGVEGRTFIIDPGHIT